MVGLTSAIELAAISPASVYVGHTCYILCSAFAVKRDCVNCKRSDCSEKEKYARGGGGRCEDRERCFGFKYWDGMYYRRVSIRVSHSRVDEVRWREFVGVDSARGDVHKD